jgi:hypothetical protein
MERQAEQRQDGIVDLVLIDLHAPNAMPPILHLVVASV